MITKTITFRAFQQIDVPEYEITYHGKTFYYNPLLNKVKFIAQDSKIRIYRLGKLQELFPAQLDKLGVLRDEILHILSFCGELPIFPNDNNTLNCVKNPVIIKKSVRLKIATLASTKTRKDSQREVRLKKGSKPRYKKEENLYYTYTDNTPFTKPEVRIQYDKWSGKNLFYVDFSYLRNGLLMAFNVPLEKINGISNIEKRNKKAVVACKEIHLQLTYGVTPEKVMLIGRNFEAMQQYKRDFDWQYPAALMWPNLADLETRLISLLLSVPPPGYTKWTLRILAEKMVELNYTHAISYTTVNSILEKHHFGFVKGKGWCFQQSANAEAIDKNHLIMPLNTTPTEVA